tara:strand:- start:30882 stop:31793 length:912 start_codon:yes stop_codon:yes gene_type:complete
MSFLNPVNEPVRHFKSTDPGAPQINNNNRVAGDVKAVIKACLVSGYGAITSAGWSVVNEDSNIAEFSSPSAAMSDYRLGIDDTSSSNTTWYYQYQGVRVNPSYNAPVKSLSYINKTSTSNGWDLLVSDQGLYFIERFYHTNAGKIVCRVMWWGRVKSALTDTTGVNISYFCSGYGAQVSQPAQLFDTSGSGAVFRFYKIASYDRVDFVSGNMSRFTQAQAVYGASTMDSIAELYLSSSGVMVGQQPGLLLRDINLSTNALGVSDITVNERPALSIALSTQADAETTVTNYAKTIVIRTDYWGF